MTEEEENMDYEEDYGNEDNIDIEADNIFEGKYEFLTKDEMDKEREKKIEYLRAAIQEGIDSGVCEDFDPEEHLKQLKAAHRNG